MSCSEKPIFVIVKETKKGYSFDNTVEYKSPFATHVLTQPVDATHPSLVVDSNWGIGKKNTITQMLTGNSGFEMLKKKRNTNFVKSHEKGITVGLLNTGDGGYKLARTAPLSGDAPSVKELSILLSDISATKGDIKVRGSPLEYKRLLDYLQFFMSRKVSLNRDLFLMRPNNVHVMDDVNDTVSLEEAYLGLFDSDASNRTMYGKAYFVSMDRLAALASVIQGTPTVYQTVAPQNYYIVPSTNSIQTIKRVLDGMLKQRGYTIPIKNVKLSNLSMHSNRYKKLITPTQKVVVTKGKLFPWFLDVRDHLIKNSGKATQRYVGTNFHKMSGYDRALILFYWIFNYPTSGTTNIKIIEAFFSILDTFHDFVGSRATKEFSSIVGNSKIIDSTRKTRINDVSFENVKNTKVQHKALVKLLGIDIYRKVKAGYNSSLKNIITKSNTRKEISPNEKVGRFLYFITNILSSDQGTLVKECENLARDVLLEMADNKAIYERPRGFNFVFGDNKENDLCKKLKQENACLVIDAISGSLPECLAEYSVYHNVGVLDPASRSILSWSEVKGNEDCIETATERRRKKRKRNQERKKRQQLKNNRKKAEAKAAALAKAKKTKEERIKQEAEKAARNKAELERKRLEALDRRAKLAARRSEPVTVSGKRKINNINNQPKSIKRLRTVPKPVTVKRVRNNGPSASTRSAILKRRKFNAPPSSGTRSASVRPPQSIPKPQSTRPQTRSVRPPQSIPKPQSTRPQTRSVRTAIRPPQSIQTAPKPPQSIPKPQSTRPQTRSVQKL